MKQQCHYFSYHLAFTWTRDANYTVTISPQHLMGTSVPSPNHAGPTSSVDVTQAAKSLPNVMQVLTLGRSDHDMLLLLSLFVFHLPAIAVHQLMILTAPSGTTPYFPLTPYPFMDLFFTNDICFFHLKPIFQQ